MYTEIIKESLTKARDSGFISDDDLISLSNIKAWENHRKTKSRCGTAKYYPREKRFEIIIYPYKIIECFYNGYYFNGIKCGSVREAKINILKHEIAHVINTLHGGSGHDEKFSKISECLFGQSEFLVRP